MSVDVDIIVGESNALAIEWLLDQVESLLASIPWKRWRLDGDDTGVNKFDSGCWFLCAIVLICQEPCAS